MAGDNTSITVRLPSALAKWADEQPGTRTDVVSRALLALRDGMDRIPALEAEIKRLRALSVDRAMQAVAKGRTAGQSTAIGRHPNGSGPTFEPKLSFTDTTTVTPRFRAGSTAEKLAK